MDPTALIGGLVVTIIGGIIVVLVQKWLESRGKQHEKDTSTLEEVTPPELPTPKVPNNLPQPGEFIGREREKAEVREALASRSFLVSIDGIGGIGKTALALEVVRECLQASKGEAPADGIPVFDAFIWTTAKDRELALSDILDTVARTLDYPYIAQLPLEEKPSEAAKLLRAQKCLLIVDNFETITDDAVRDFLLDLPEPSKALVTSRYQLPAKLLSKSRAVSLYKMDQNEALALIRSEGKRLGLEAMEKAEEKVLLCLYEATGGAPLAIKWAVGQMKQRGQSLDTVLDYLYEARGDVFENIFAHSCGLLSENAKRVLMVMPIFATSASKAAIEAASNVHKWDLDEALGQLVEMWLVEVSKELDEAKRRYSIHPLTRAFAGARLGENKEWEGEARLRAADCFLSFAKQYGKSDDWCGHDVLEDEVENIIDMIEWCDKAGNREMYVEFVLAFDGYGFLRGYWDEQVGQWEKVAAIAKQEGDPLLVERSLRAIGRTLSWQGEYDQAEKILEEARLVAESVDKLSGYTLDDLSIIAYFKGDIAKARELRERALQLHLKTGNQYAVAWHRYWLGVLAYVQGQYEEAQGILEQSLAEAEMAKNTRVVGYILHYLGNIAREQGEYEQAGQFYVQGLSLIEKFKDKHGIAYLKRSQALLEDRLGNFVEALKLANEASDLFRRLGMTRETETTRELVERLEARIAEARE